MCGHQQPCLHGATCSNEGPDQHSCSCVAGYTGNNCHTEINKCDSLPCPNGATCNVRMINVCISRACYDRKLICVSQDNLNHFSCLCAVHVNTS